MADLIHDNMTICKVKYTLTHMFAYVFYLMELDGPPHTCHFAHTCYPHFEMFESSHILVSSIYNERLY